jgi:hypothetical protein
VCLHVTSGSSGNETCWREIKICLREECEAVFIRTCSDWSENDCSSLKRLLSRTNQLFLENAVHQKIIYCTFNELWRDNNTIMGNDTIIKTFHPPSVVPEDP